MFENRIRGAHLAKRASYGYLFFAVILFIAGFALEGYEQFYVSGVIFAIMFAAVYTISTKLAERKNSWILLIACAVISVILSPGFIAIAFGLLLVISANDIRKELD